ncbi:MAG: hypothetical protein Q7R67_01210 [bacterium]|nr:hypothetical protein [bacterium]
MSTKIKILISAIVIGVVYNFYIFSRPLPSEGWAGISQSLGFVFGAIAIAIIFGIAGFLFTKLDTSWGQRFLQCFTWFGFALVVILPMVLIVGRVLAPSRNAAWRAANPPYQNYDSNAPYYQAPLQKP